jgi:superfamily II DNA or RNA helicase
MEFINTQHKIPDDWLKYEYMCIEKHCQDNPDHKMFHWGDLPENILEDSGYIHDKNIQRLTRLKDRAKAKNKPLREYGLDGLGYTYKPNGEIMYLPFQAKYRENSIILKDSCLGTFHGSCETVRFKHPNSIGYLYYTCRLSRDVMERYERTKYVKPIKFLSKTNNTSNNSDYIVQELHIEQKNFLKKLNTSWTGIGLICLPCGYGKFVIASHFACKYEKIILISPLRVDTKQAFDRIKPYVPDHTILLFDSDKEGTTDIQELEKTFKSSKYCICTTQKSAVNVLSRYSYDKDVLFVIDEIHEYNETHQMWDLLYQTEATRLGMTATKTETLVSKTNELIYMPLSKAIEQKKVCDYEIYLPILENEGDNKYFERFLPDELSMRDNIDILSKILFLVTGMYNYGFRHCILYLSTIQECSEYKKIIEEVFKKYYGGECSVGIITANCSSQERSNAMNNFKNNLMFTFLCSVRILDQNIDIPICDSVFITSISSSTSEVRTLQRLGRAYRIVKNNPCKTAGCFLWTDSDNDLCNMLNMIKTEDPEFYKKVKRISSIYSTQKSIRTQKENYHTNLTKKFVKLKCVSLDEKIRGKLNDLTEYFSKNKEPPRQSKQRKDEYMEKYEFDLGVFWSSLLNGRNKELFEEYRKKSINMENAYQKYLNKKTPEEKIKSKT